MLTLVYAQRARFLLLVLVLCATHQAAGFPVGLPPSGAWASLAADSLRRDTLPHRVALLPEQGSLATQLAHLTQEARQQHLTPVLDLGAWWCSPCHALDSVLAMPELRPAMQQVYLIHLESDLWREALDSLGVEHSTIPRLVALDSASHPVHEPWIPKLESGWSPAVLESIRQYIVLAQTRFH